MSKFSLFIFNVRLRLPLKRYFNSKELNLEDTRFRKKPQIGTRKLIDPDKVYEFNAWDNYPWDSEQEENAVKKVQSNSTHKISEERRYDFDEKAVTFWDSFYEIHSNKFFKDRQWLFTEFPEIDPSYDKPNSTNSKNSNLKIFEIGCGVGNTVFPILRQISEHQKPFIYASDFSEKAVNILKESQEYDPERCNAFVLDVTQDEWVLPFEEESIDIVVIIFMLSAINPDRFEHVVRKVKRCLVPGGMVLFRDYGRYDLAQLRFKDGQCLSDNFYVRGDGTRVYFFTQAEVRDLFINAGFIEEQNRVDRRLQVNRGKMLKMYRVWVQAKYRKPFLQGEK